MYNLNIISSYKCELANNRMKDIEGPLSFDMMAASDERGSKSSLLAL